MGAHSRHATAIVGASDNNFWTHWAIRNLQAYEYTGEIWPVNPRRETVAGLRAYPDLAQLPRRPDVTLVAVATEQCQVVVKQAAEAGCPLIAVLSDSFAESGTEDGREQQNRLVRICREHGVRMYGPNGVGFADFATGICAIAEPIPMNVKPGSISIITQSGALLSCMLAGFVEEGLGIDWCLSLGNGAEVGFADALEIALNRSTTQLICAYAEGFGDDLNRVSRLLEEGAAAGKRFVFVKTGASAASRRLALSHTASIAGENHVIDAFLRHHGVIRARDLQEMIRTASLLHAVGNLPAGKGVVVLTSSGGAAGLSGDLAHLAGAKLAEFSEETRARIAALAPSGSFLENPLDLTGRMGGQETARQIYELIYRDPNVGIVLNAFSIIFPDNSEGRLRHRQTLDYQAEVSALTGVPTLVVSMTIQGWTDWMLEYRQSHPEVLVVQGISDTFRALAHLFPAEPLATKWEAKTGTHGTDGGQRVLDEAAGRAVLEEIGFPVAPGRPCADPEAAVEAFRHLKPPVAVKVIASGVSHKARIGGVRLGCYTVAQVEEAARSILAAVPANGVPAHQIGGVLVEEMVRGTELIIGLVRDPQFGPHVTVGLGGSLAETTHLNGTGLLPISLEEAGRLMDRAGLGRFIRSHSCGEQLLSALVRLGAEFAGGALRRFQTVEINPLILTDTGPYAADVLIIEPASSINGA